MNLNTEGEKLMFYALLGPNKAWNHTYISKKKKVLATRYKEIGKEKEAAEKVRALPTFLWNRVIAELEYRSYVVKRHSCKEQQ